MFGTVQLTQPPLVPVPWRENFLFTPEQASARATSDLAATDRLLLILPAAVLRVRVIGKHIFDPKIGVIFIFV